MPDARETLKLLARSKRHKGRDIKVPPSGYKPVTPKKIKRDGPTRPYQQNNLESTHSDELTANESTGALTAEGVQEYVSDRTEEKAETVSNQTETSAILDIHEEKHKSTDYRKANSELSESRLPEKRKAESKLADTKLANVRKADNQEAANRKAALAAPTGGVTLARAKVSEPPVARSYELVDPLAHGSQHSVPTELSKNSAWSRDLVDSSVDDQIPERDGPIQPRATDSGPLGAKSLNNFYNGLQPSTENKEANFQLSEFRKADPNGLRNGAYARTDFSAVEELRYESKQRSVGKTVTNLAKRSLIYPDWVTDFTRDESFLRGYFRKTFGNGKHMKEVDLYCQLYSIACANRSVTLHFLSAQIGGLVGSNSNGTIRTRLLTCEKLGLFIQQGFNNETPEHKRGTYIHLKFPWFDGDLI